jgi:hypothetical protein
MLAEHQAIVAALNELREAAARTGRSEIVAFAEALVEHARTEEEVMYPAAVLVGQVVRQRLAQLAAWRRENGRHANARFLRCGTGNRRRRPAGRDPGAAEGGVIEYHYSDAGSPATRARPWPAPG